MRRVHVAYGLLASAVLTNCSIVVGLQQRLLDGSPVLPGWRTFLTADRRSPPDVHYANARHSRRCPEGYTWVPNAAVRAPWHYLHTQQRDHRGVGPHTR